MNAPNKGNPASGANARLRPGPRRSAKTHLTMKTPKPKDSKMWRDSYYHKLFGLKAAQEAGMVLRYFEEERPADKRPREAIEAIREWAEGTRTLGMKAVRKLSLAAHAAGQAVGTWHAPAHALGAFGYAGRARMAGKNKSSKK